MIDLPEYSLSDFLMFSPETYFRLYELHNAALWPAQLIAVAAAILLLVLAWKQRAAGGTLVLLAVAWGLIGWSFFYRLYAEIFLAAPWFAYGFALEALLLLPAALSRRSLPLSFRPAAFGVLSFAVLVHPLIGPLFGRDWSGIEIFLLAPDPTAVGTLGVLLMMRGSLRFLLAAVPLLWCVVSGLTYLAMGEHWGLATPLAALVAIGLMVRQGVTGQLRESA